MNLEPQSRAVLDALNASGLLPFRQLDPVSMRLKMLSLRPARPASPAHEMASVTEEAITTPDGAFRVRILKPRTAAPDEVMPVVIYFHGGGFFGGGIDETDELARRLAKDADAVVVNVDYHLSPEARFPVAVNDAYAALCWVAEHAARLGIDPARIVLAGDSSGGNLTVITCLTTRERGGPRVRFQAAIYPSLDLRARPQYPSRLQWGGGGYVLENDDIEWMLDAYLADRADANSWRASPIMAETYAGLPPALVVTASHDPLRDEGKRYADRLSTDGVPVEYACFEGTFHGFIGYASVLEVGARGVTLVCDRIRAAVWP